MTANAFLLTYNPKYWFWPTADRTLAAKNIARGHLAPDRWNAGSRKTGIFKGDLVFVLQQGHGQRGLIAQGQATSQIYQAPHWDGIAGHVGNYVDVNWTGVTLNPYVHTEELRMALPYVNWSPRQSGSQVPQHSVSGLHTLSAHALADFLAQ